MGSFNTAMKVLDYVKTHPGKDVRARAIAKATGATPSGVTGVLRRVIKSAREPVVEGRQGREVTFRFMPSGDSAPGVPGEIAVSILTANGHAVSLTIEQAREVYDQLKALFSPPAQG